MKKEKIAKTEKMKIQHYEGSNIKIVQFYWILCQNNTFINLKPFKCLVWTEVQRYFQGQHFSLPPK